MMIHFRHGIEHLEFSPNWEIRHGAALALREIIKVQGASGGMRGSLFLECESCVVLISGFRGLIARRQLHVS